VNDHICAVSFRPVAISQDLFRPPTGIGPARATTPVRAGATTKARRSTPLDDEGIPPNTLVVEVCVSVCLRVCECVCVCVCACSEVTRVCGLLA
jgi:hypothetical protein